MGVSVHVAFPPVRAAKTPLSRLSDPAILELLDVPDREETLDVASHIRLRLGPVEGRAHADLHRAVLPLERED